MKFLPMLLICGCAFLCGKEFSARQMSQFSYDSGWSDGYTQCQADIGVMLDSGQRGYSENFERIEILHVGL